MIKRPGCQFHDTRAARSSLHFLDGSVRLTTYIVVYLFSRYFTRIPLADQSRSPSTDFSLPLAARDDTSTRTVKYLTTHLLGHPVFPFFSRTLFVVSIPSFHPSFTCHFLDRAVLACGNWYYR